MTGFCQVRSVRRIVRCIAVLAVAVAGVGVAASPSAALRHLRLVRSSPSKDATLTTSPDAIQLWLSEPTELPGSRVTLATEAGAVVATAALTRAGVKSAPLVATLLKPLAAGTYKVTWKAMSKDGHVVSGMFGFKIAGR